MSNVDALNQAYGWAGSLADIPEIKAILDEAVAKHWTDDLLVAAIENSTWAKTHRQSQVEWEINSRLHPADAQAQRHQLELDIDAKAKALGMPLTKERIHTMSGYALVRGFSEDEIQRMILSEFHYDPKLNNGIASGTTASTLDQLKGISKAYMVPVSDPAIKMWVDAIIRGENNLDSYTEWVKEQAKGLYPALASQLDGGVTTKTLMDPYAGIAEQELGIFDLDMSDPKYMDKLMTIDPKTGMRTMPNLDQWRSTLRTDPVYNWQGTVGAQNMTAQLGDALLREMGAKA